MTTGEYVRTYGRDTDPVDSTGKATSIALVKGGFLLGKRSRIAWY